MSFRKDIDFYENDIFDIEDVEIEMPDIIENLSEFEEYELKELHVALHKKLDLRLPLDDEYDSETVDETPPDETYNFVFEYQNLDDEFKFQTFMEFYHKYSSWELREKLNK